MKKNAQHISLAAAVICSLIAATGAISCAKVESESSNSDEALYLQAYIRTHFPDAVKIGMGSYIVEDIPGNGLPVKDSSYLFLRLVSRNLLDGSYVYYNSPDVAKQLGTYNSTNDYSDFVMRLVPSDVSKGLRDACLGGEDKEKDVEIAPLRIGGRRKVIVPSYLSNTSYNYETLEEYIRNASGANSFFYEMELVDQTPDILQWQVDSIERFMDKTTGRVDSVKYHRGLYYIRDIAREKERGYITPSTHKFPDDTTIYINYTGRLLSGKVFDTTIADTAKVWGIYSATKKYAPQSVTWDADSTALKLGGSSVIKGFSYTLWQMHPHESGRGIFTSDMGYGATSGSSQIPNYAPLIFDIDIVDKP